MSPDTNSRARRPTVTNSSVSPMERISQTVNSRMASWFKSIFRGGPMLKALRRECSRQLVARMGNQMEKTRLNHSSWRLALADTYIKYASSTETTSAGTSWDRN